MLHLVTIDFWDTIVLNNHDWDKEILEELSLKLISFGSEHSITEIAKAFKIEENHFTHALNTNSVTLSNRSRVEYVTTLLKLPLHDYQLDELIKLIDSQIQNPLPQLTKHIEKFLSDLHNLGLPICLISNTGWFSGKAISLAIACLGLDKYFSKMIFSDEFGSAKPSRDIFLSAIKSFGYLPNEVVHIGDSIKNDIVGAINAGVQPIHYSHCICFKNDLYPSFNSFDDVLIYIKKITNRKNIRHPNINEYYNISSKNLVN